MMQPGAGVVPPPMAPPTMDQQHPPQQQQQPSWMMMPPPPQAQHPPPQMWAHQQQAQPPQMQQQVAPPQMQQQQMPTPQPQQMQYSAVAQPQYSAVAQQQYSAVGQAQYPQAQAQPAPTSVDEIRTLWIGDLQYWMEENYIHSCFAQSGEVLSVKVIRNKQTGQTEGYGFIEFANRAAAERTLQAYNGTLMPNSEQTFRLNWASFGSGDKRSDDGPDFPIFVGDLASDVTDYMLQETFRSHYPSVKGAKVVTDRATGRSKGYGFVRFGDESEQLRAMTEMNGVFCSTRPMRIGPATTKKSVGSQQQYPTKGCQGALFI